MQRRRLAEMGPDRGLRAGRPCSESRVHAGDDLPLLLQKCERTRSRGETQRAALHLGTPAGKRLDERLEVRAVGYGWRSRLQGDRERGLDDLCQPDPLRGDG